ncbi:MAG: hypothetical protein JRG89_17185 [Deltaproteobacteria bacterium]|nr:hypothetical protein [Deltaproteobacteria bacterium]
MILRQLVAADAGELVRCFERCYGKSYVDGDFYHEAMIRSRLAEGRLRSIVAVNEQDEIVGHMGLSARHPDALTADAGNTVVDPRYRNQKLAARIGLELFGLSREIGLVGFHHYPTTAHPVMQKLAVQAGGVETGIMLDYIPGETDYKGFADEQAAQRLSTTVVYQPLAPAPPRDIYLPERYRELVAWLCAASKLDRRLHEPAAEPLSSRSQLVASVYPRRRLLRIEVRRSGADLVEAVARQTEGAEVDVIQLDLPLADSGVSLAVEVLRSEGFYYSALLPEYFEGDVLRLQKTTGPFQTALREKLATADACSLFAFIEKDRQPELGSEQAGVGPSKMEMGTQ